MNYVSYEEKAAPILQGYFMLHEATGSVGFSWDKDDSKFPQDWKRVLAVPADESGKGGDAKKGPDDSPLREALGQTLTGIADQIPEGEIVYSDGSVKADTSYEHLRWMVSSCLDNLKSWPIDKLSRWTGFVQGVQILRGDMSSTAERDRTRPLFHAAYEAMGIEKPETVERREVVAEVQVGSRAERIYVVKMSDPWDYSQMETRLRPELVGRWSTVPLSFGDGAAIIAKDSKQLLVHFSDYATAQHLTALHNSALDQIAPESK